MKIIAHLDMDAFFAAIEERENPQYKGLGIVVGADPREGVGRGVVSTANYQARKYGIHSAQPISIAWRLSQDAIKKGEPKTIFLPVNHHYYSEVSRNIFNFIRRSVPLVEQTSVDEGYLDLSFTGSFEKARDLVHDLVENIREKERLTAKVAISPNKLVAKIATSRSKPDSMSIIYPHFVQNFLDPLPVGDIPGIGPKTEQALFAKKISLISDLRKQSRENLVSWFGKSGEGMYKRARGMGEDTLSFDNELKSISEQETFDVDTLSSGILIPKIEALSGRVGERMVIEGIKGFKTVTITVRFGDFTTVSRSHTVKEFTSDTQIIQKEAMKLFFPFLDARENPQKKLIRLLGVGIEGFTPVSKKVVPKQLEMVS